ncbi:hypothetical protein EXIGLDRAFT_717138 [Exidia glandulosa HHB12029]|uniref:F5/8 type C domain-containing protein n=1 Tax=Exidia glandulosa HHB12029 TaxID=1314781 RepID=A0A165IHM5_EXIGL|nr:hypothetical protein EXIGLDRAFT_717138 [Exidia glandulosa HHB12029]
MDELEYEIHGESSHSAKYFARNIKSRDTSSDSRWTAASPLGPEPQFIVLKLDQVCVLKSVLMGKYYKSHPCNVQVFEVHVGQDPSRMTLVLRDQLQDNGIWETFNVLWRDADGLPIACRYVKIVPISTHHATFHPSLWHVSLYGTSDEDQVEAIRADLLLRKEARAIRLMAKYLRQRGFQDPCTQLLAQSGQTLEHPCVTTLRDALAHGDWAAAEHAIRSAVESGLFDEHLQSTRPTLVWRRLRGTNADGDVPPGLTEHSMCFDPHEQTVFVIGGWDGTQHVCDVHAYAVANDRWRSLSLEGAPQNLQHHRSVLDSFDGCLYVFVPVPDEGSPPTEGAGDQSSSLSMSASVVDTLLRVSPRKSGKFALYRCTTRCDPCTWTCISSNISSVGGPGYTLDFDVTLDTETRTVYMRTSPLSQRNGEPKTASQLHSYSLGTGEWTALPPAKDLPALRGRLCAVGDATQGSRLWMLGANGPTSAMSVHTVDVRTSDVDAVPPAGAPNSGLKPPSSLVLEPTLGNQELQEVYIFHETTGGEGGHVIGEPNTLWIYQCRRRRWMTTQPGPARPGKQPPERVVFQSAYDPQTQTFYQFGGLLVHGLPQQKPLGQLWRAKLQRPTRVDILNKAMFALREQQFLEMCRAGVGEIETLEFIRSGIVPFINVADRRTVQDFCSTVARLYGVKDSEGGGGDDSVSDGDSAAAKQNDERVALFDALVEMVNPSAREPAENLLDVVDSVLL